MSKYATIVSRRNTKNIMKNFSEIHSLEEIENELKLIKKLRNQIQQHFNFEIVDYILDDIIEGAYFHHICLMINMAKVNNRISEKNGEILKKGLKQIYNVKNNYDRIVVE